MLKGRGQHVLKDTTWRRSIWGADIGRGWIHVKAYLGRVDQAIAEFELESTVTRPPSSGPTVPKLHIGLGPR